MKQFISKLPVVMMLAVLITLFLSGCVEHRYYSRNHHHSRHYYERRHEPVPAGIDVEIRR